MIIQKIYRCKIPAVIQNLVLVFARVFNVDVVPAINFLGGFSHENKMALKVLLDKWLLQQQLFSGKAIKNVTYFFYSVLTGPASQFERPDAHFFCAGQAH